MKVVAICGTDKNGMTQALQHEFLGTLGPDVELVEFSVPRDLAAFCSGCTKCIIEGEEACKDYLRVREMARAMLQADLLVFSSPTYVFHATGSMKAFLDHFAYMWMTHRPQAEMFKKHAVILTQCMGAGARHASRDIRDSLRWWGIPHIQTLSVSLAPTFKWNELPEKKHRRIVSKLRRIAHKCRGSVAPNLCTFSMFHLSRLLKKALESQYPDDPDTVYWRNRGWLGNARPWDDTTVQ